MLPSALPNVRLPELEITSVAPPAGAPSAAHKRRRTTWVDAPIDLRIADDSPKPRRFARFARPVLTAGTMVAVLAMAVVTTLPANAFYSETEAIPPAQSAAVVEPAQVLPTTAAEAAAIARDNYTVESAPEPPAPAVAPPAGASGAASSGAPTGLIRWPFDGAARISDPFGPRVSPCAGCSSSHKGTDYLPGDGNPVYSIADGVVRSTEESDSGLGVNVVIEHTVDGRLLTSTYAHMQFGAIQVVPGQAVSAGQMVGRVGNTGASTGPHLHLELRWGGTDAFDSYAWLSQRAS